MAAGRSPGAGSAAYHPSDLLALLIYGYATGTFGSRRFEQATHESLAFRYIAAKAELQARAAERDAAQQADYEAKLKARADKTEQTGKKPRGKPPSPPNPGVRTDDQVNLTYPDSRIMPVAGGGFEQCYNAQAAVDTDTMLVVATGLTQAANDKQQLTPVLTTLNALPDDLGAVTRLLADAGYYSAANVTACLNLGIEPLLASVDARHIICPGKRASVSHRRC